MRFKKHLLNHTSAFFFIVLGAVGIGSSVSNGQTLPPLEVLQDTVDLYEFFESSSGVAPEDLPPNPVTEEEYQAALENIENYTQLESRCGKHDDSIYITDMDTAVYRPEVVEQIDANEATVGQIRWKFNLATAFPPPDADPGNVAGSRWCTAFLFDEDKMLTAGHCFDVKSRGWITPKKGREGKTLLPIPPASIATFMEVAFGYYDPEDPYGDVKTFPVEGLLLNRPRNLDVAIFRIGRDQKGRLPGDYGIGTMALDFTGDPEAGEPIFIIQHPAGTAKKVDTGQIASITKTMTFSYRDIDTLGGSSGSPVTRLSDGKVVGVHIKGGCTEFGGANHATMLKAIAEEMQ